MYLIWLLLILTLNKSNCQNRDEKPIIEDLFTSSKLVENKKFSITCQVSNSLAEIEWFLNGQKVLPNENIVFNNFEDHSILIIKSVGIEHSGDYSCKVKNRFGEDSRSISVKLNGKF